MKTIEDSNITNNDGVRFLNNWKSTNNLADLKFAIQYFEKAIAAARTESEHTFEIAEKNLKSAKYELAKYV